MSNPAEQPPYGITIPVSIYKRTIKKFEHDYNADFDDAIISNPRFAYEAFNSSLKDAIMVGRTSLYAASRGVSVDRELDGEQAFEGVAETTLDGVLRPLSEEAGEVVIKVMRGQTFLNAVLKRHKEPKLKEEIRFTIPALEH